MPWALSLTALFLVLALWPGADTLLRYHRESIAAGQVWRVFTGHFVHLNLAHALLNGAGTLLLAAVFSRDLTPRACVVMTLATPFVISLGLWLKQPGLFAYVGFSGVLHGLLYFGVLRLLLVAPWLAGTALLLLIGRQVWEQTAAYDPDYLRGLIGGRVMPDAHLFGALTGLAAGAWSLWRDRLHKPRGTGYSAGTGPSPDA
jgi:rhomboid family GlyGly-CTERM serine protease